MTFRYNEEGKQIRVSKRSGQEVPFPPQMDATVDYGKKSDYKRKHIYIYIFNNKTAI